jgi:molybdate transport system ATP-binding protein
VSLSVSIDLDLPGFALRVAFDVGDGVTALFGPSGAGKTTTLRVIAGLADPRSGRIVVSGRTLLDADAAIRVPPRERRIGYLFQQYALFPHLTVDRNVAYGLHRLPRGARAERVHELLRLVGLEGFERRRPTELSGGQQQRGGAPPGRPPPRRGAGPPPPRAPPPEGT